MPGRRTAVAVDPSLCRRCQTNEPTITIRTEPLCATCFVKYASTKVVKRMESFRVRNSDPDRGRILLLPLSFGPSSTSLLHILSQHLKGQNEKTGRTGFKLHVLHVRMQDGDADATPLERVKQQYPEHAYSVYSLSEVLALDSVQDVLPKGALLNGTDATYGDGEAKHSLTQLMSFLDSATSQADMTQILFRRLIVEKARALECEAVIFGDSTTRLAERTLAETAKGRGSSLPWVVADGDAIHGLLFYYPMRDLLTKEIVSFTTLVDPPLTALLTEVEVKPAVSTKHTTIDDLMRQYFESVEQEYPSIVANVVKTSGKLQATSLSEIEQQCELCDLPLDGQAPARSRLCYGCIRMLPQTTN